ncbi:AraD1 family protein [Paragemmobacter straminiformis]|uniref:GguC protein n=1 Tax=Paragemmobacter straminiformis TaxID=2045119 RepID=A0A842I643_9RHOB|nr:AraD1 family protein [Gemmobacter straminiformis]MBC2834418.1 GguC protein [Gemmobacter straminiformis]
MLISQIIGPDGKTAVVVREGSEAAVLRATPSTYALAMEAAGSRRPVAAVVAERGLGEAVDLPSLLAAGRVTLPITHPDPVHMHLTGTGLTHLGSASARNAMHAKLEGAEVLTDSMKMFRMGLEGGRPQAGAVGAQPEWFYKGNGTTAVAPGGALTMPGFAEDGGEEPEIAGIYVIAPDGAPCRLGWALANEFSDHVTERVNYLWLAHSKLRQASFGPEILIGDLPADVQGTSRIHRGGAVVWEKPFVSGEANMSHSFANLEHHHFKYDIFRHPGDVHVHMFGTATLSFADGFGTQAGDVFEIEAAPFGLPLKNTLAKAPAIDGTVAVTAL